MAMHEGQSLLSEMQVSRSREFLEFLLPHVHAAFPDAVHAQPEAFTVDNLYRFFTRVSRGKIRVDADELTYPCHIIVRYDIERQLIDGNMRVEQIPEAWDTGMRELLGIGTGHDYRDGCMQDVHWPSGAFGYFPTYTLGAMTAAQLFRAARRLQPSLPRDIASGSFDGLNAFLRDAVWSQASILSADEIVQRATGESLDPLHFEAHLRKRYLGDLIPNSTRFAAPPLSATALPGGRETRLARQGSCAAPPRARRTASGRSRGSSRACRCVAATRSRRCYWVGARSRR